MSLLDITDDVAVGLALQDPPAPLSRDVTVFPASDLDNAAFFANRNKHRFRYVAEQRQWLAWRPPLWRPDVTGEASRAAKEVARDLQRLAADIDDDSARKKAARHALTAQSERSIRSMLTLASTEAELAISADQLDAQPFLLACRNGVLDLTTGELSPPDPGLLISRGTSIPYEPDATCPRWEQFLSEIYNADRELIDAIQRAFGYSLTGDTREQKLFVQSGAGCNGKSTLIAIFKRIAGHHATTASFDTFVRSRNNGVRNDLARLHRARVVFAAESGDGRRLDEAVIKSLTGGDTIAARFLYGEHFEFEPRFKLWLSTNRLPRVDGDDDAIWRRIWLIPHNVSFRGREDLTLADRLNQELPGILAWAVRGTHNWLHAGLGNPAAVTQATSNYRESEDHLGAFLADHCTVNHGASIETAALRTAYERFCEERGERPPNATALGMALSRRGITVDRNTKPRRYIGITLTP